VFCSAIKLKKIPPSPFSRCVKVFRSDGADSIVRVGSKRLLRRLMEAGGLESFCFVDASGRDLEAEELMTLVVNDQ
jgi:hypothetical protein